MSDAEDYMSDSVLAGTEDVRPGLLFSRGQKRVHENYKKKLRSSKAPKTLAEREMASRNIGLETPISTENKGFQLLVKMGFKATDPSIGRSRDGFSGIQEPLKIETKATKTGLGHDTEEAEKQAKILHNRRENSHKLFKVFRVNTVQRTLDKQAFLDYAKAQRICEDMDTRDGITEPVCPWYWPKRHYDSDEDDDGLRADEEEPLTAEDATENLRIILDYLREKYGYCMYCVIRYECVGDMMDNCPGITREEHDDD